MNQPNNIIPSSMTHAIISFMHRLRAEGFQVGIQETIDALMIAGSGIFENRNRYRIALRAMCCCTQEEMQVFDLVFDTYWKEDRKLHKESFKKMINPEGVIDKRSSLVLMGEGKSEGENKNAKSTSGASAAERLRKTDFTKVSEIESSLLDEIARKLFREMNYRMRRRLKNDISKKQIDFRKTFRRNIENGGTPLQLLYKGRQVQKDKLVVFLDVSGSMDKYSFFLLRFIFSLKEHFKNFEAFVFSTELVRISRILKNKGIGTTIKTLSEQATRWSSGTKIGACFQAFNKAYSKHINRTNSIVIIVSDGLDTGEPQLLQQELQKIKRRSKKIIWLNPLKGMKDYTPIARGMHAAMPMIDEFGSAHNLESIMKLEKYLINA